MRSAPVAKTGALFVSLWRICSAEDRDACAHGSGCRPPPGGTGELGFSLAMEEAVSYMGQGKAGKVRHPLK